MVRFRFIEPDGKAKDVEIPIGESVMRGAQDNGVRGLTADCGGACSCATCHVYFDEAGIRVVGEASVIEGAMLEMANDVTGYSRLSCQVKVTEAMAGLTIRVADNDC